ncbi:MAG: hypothetical protein MJ094_00025 [Saccharofermentans sp.]|nr:hypothetical protein [Saccharofermentans sp.]
MATVDGTSEETDIDDKSLFNSFQPVVTAPKIEEKSDFTENLEDFNRTIHPTVEGIVIGEMIPGVGAFRKLSKAAECFSKAADAETAGDRVNYSLTITLLWYKKGSQAILCKNLILEMFVFLINHRKPLRIQRLQE